MMNYPIRIVPYEGGYRILVLSDLMSKTTRGRKEALAIIFEDYAKCQDQTRWGIYETLPKYVPPKPGRGYKIFQYLKEKIYQTLKEKIFFLVCDELSNPDSFR